MACESFQDIIDALATVEAFSVALLGQALENAANGALMLNEEQLSSFRVSRAAEQAHFKFLVGAGARPGTMIFTLPDTAVISDPQVFLKTMIWLEELSVAAYIAAAQAFALLGKSDWVQHALAIGAVEAEHRVLTRVFAIDAGIIDGLPNDVAFEKAKYASVDGATAELKAMGYVGGRGTRLAYPGPGAIDSTGLKHLHP